MVTHTPILHNLSKSHNPYIYKENSKEIIIQIFNERIPLFLKNIIKPPMKNEGGRIMKSSLLITIWTIYLN